LRRAALNWLQLQHAYCSGRSSSSSSNDSDAAASRAAAAAAAVAPETFHQDAPYHSGLADAHNHTPADASQPALKHTRSSAIADGPRDASCQLKSCRLPRNSAETTCTTSPEQIEVMKLEG